MVFPETATPATACGEPAPNVERLGGELDESNTSFLRNLQAAHLSRRAAVGFALASAVAPLAFGEGRS